MFVFVFVGAGGEASKINIEVSSSSSLWTTQLSGDVLNGTLALAVSRVGKTKTNRQLSQSRVSKTDNVGVVVLGCASV